MAAPKTMSGDFQWHRGGKTPSHNKSNSYPNNPTMRCSYTFSNFTYTNSRTIKFNYYIKIYFPYNDSYFNSPNVFRVAILWYNGDTYVGGEVILDATSMSAGTYKEASGVVEIPASQCSTKKITQVDIAINTKCDCNDYTWYDWNKCPAWYIGDPRNTGYSPYKPSKPTYSSYTTKYQLVGGTAKGSGEEDKLSFITGSSHNYAYKTRDKNGTWSSYIQYDKDKISKISNNISAVSYYARQCIHDYRYTGSDGDWSQWSDWTEYLTYYGVLLPPSSVSYKTDPWIYGSNISESDITITNNSINPSGCSYSLFWCYSSNNKKITNFPSPFPNIGNSYYLVAYTTRSNYIASARWNGTTASIKPAYNPTEYITGIMRKASTPIGVKLNHPVSAYFSSPISAGETASVAKQFLVVNSAIVNPSSLSQNYTLYEGSTAISDSYKIYEPNAIYAKVYYSKSNYENSDPINSNKLDVLKCPCNMSSRGFNTTISMLYGGTDIFNNTVRYIPLSSYVSVNFGQFSLNNHLGNFNYYKIDLYEDGKYHSTLSQGGKSSEESSSVTVQLPSTSKLGSSYQIVLTCCYQDGSGTLYSQPGDNNPHSINIISNSNRFYSTNFSLGNSPKLPKIIYPYQEYNEGELLGINKFIVELEEPDGSDPGSKLSTVTFKFKSGSHYKRTIEIDYSNYDLNVSRIVKSDNTKEIYNYIYNNSGNYSEFYNQADGVTLYSIDLNPAYQIDTAEVVVTNEGGGTSSGSYSIPSNLINITIPEEGSIINNDFLNELFKISINCLRYYYNFLIQSDLNILNKIFNKSSNSILSPDFTIGPNNLLFISDDIVSSYSKIVNLYDLLVSVYYRVIISTNCNFNIDIEALPAESVTVTKYKLIDKLSSLPGEYYFKNLSGQWYLVDDLSITSPTQEGHTTKSVNLSDYGIVVNNPSSTSLFTIKVSYRNDEFISTDETSPGLDNDHIIKLDSTNLMSLDNYIYQIYFIIKNLL